MCRAVIYFYHVEDKEEKRDIMKNGIIFKLLITGVVLLFFSIVSFFVLDYANLKSMFWNELYSIDIGLQGKHLDMEEGVSMIAGSKFGDRDQSLGMEGELESITNIEIDSVNLEVQVEKGEENTYRIYQKGKEIDVTSSWIDVKKEAETLYVKEKKKSGQSPRFKLIVTAARPEELAVEINSVNGGFSATHSLKEFTGDFVNGAMSLSGEESYPVEVSSVNAAVNINFKHYNSVLRVETINGIGTVLGNPLLKVADMGLGNIEQVVGEGRDNIYVETVNGAIVIE